MSISEILRLAGLTYYNMNQALHNCTDKMVLVFYMGFNHIDENIAEIGTTISIDYFNVKEE